jgi:hypothetical protein
MRSDYYEPDFDDDDPRMETIIDADCDLRLAGLWQSAFESEVLDDASDVVIGFVAEFVRQAYTAGFDDGQEKDVEPCLVDRHWTERWQRVPAHDRL